MSVRSRNMPLVLGLAIVISLVLTCAMAALDGLVVNGSCVGFLIRTIPLAVAVPFALIGFNGLCDRCERRIVQAIYGKTREEQSGLIGRGVHHGVEDAELRDRFSVAVSRRNLNGNRSQADAAAFSRGRQESVAPGTKRWVGQ